MDMIEYSEVISYNGIEKEGLLKDIALFVIEDEEDLQRHIEEERLIES